MRGICMRSVLIGLCVVLSVGLFACSHKEGQTSSPTAGTVGTQNTGTATPTVAPTSTPEPVNPILDEVSAEAVSWISGKTNADSVILTIDQIEAENEEMQTESNALTDIIRNIPVSYGEYALKAMLAETAFPSNARYDSEGNWMSQATVDAILNNRGIDQVLADNPVRMGIVTGRGHLRRFPTSQGAYKAGGDPYDRLQETELYVGMPVWVLHASTDGLFYYVQSYYYRGWVDVDCVALTDNKEEWLGFAEPASFVTVLRPLLKVGEVWCDMGVKLPCLTQTAGDFVVELPVRSADGSLESREVTVSGNDAYLGYLPYTYENFIAQAFLYQGTAYGWGGLDNGVDCSGFVAAVFRTFGFELPRNTGDQQVVLGSAVAVSGQGHTAISERLQSTLYPTAVYTSGHVMIYLGESDRGAVFIHAPSIGQTVQVTVRSDLSGVLYINEVGI